MTISVEVVQKPSDTRESGVAEETSVMPRYKLVDRSPRFLAVVLEEQILPGTFEFALDHLVDHDLDLTGLDTKFRNDVTDASAYDPRVMLKIVLPAYIRGLISSRSIERACRDNVLFMAISGDQAPTYTSIAKFVRELGSEIGPLFTQVLLVCVEMDMIGREMFVIDGVELPGNASKERSGTHAELAQKAARHEKAASKIVAAHRNNDEGKPEPSLDAGRLERAKALSEEAARIRAFIAFKAPRRNDKGKEIKGNVTDPDSAKMATGKGVIQGYAAQAAVDAKRQVIVAAEVLGSGAEQRALLPILNGNRQPTSRFLTTSFTVFRPDGSRHARCLHTDERRATGPARMPRGAYGSDS